MENELILLQAVKLLREMLDLHKGPPMFDNSDLKTVEETEMFLDIYENYRFGERLLEDLMNCRRVFQNEVFSFEYALLKAVKEVFKKHGIELKPVCHICGGENDNHDPDCTCFPAGIGSSW